MRCQKVCSCLPAYCNNELTGKTQIEVSEHLAQCQRCRSEEAAYQAIRHGVSGQTKIALSPNFNAKLLERVAQERFAETRSAAYLPMSSPRLFKRGFLPAVALTAVICMAVGFGVSSRLSTSTPTLATLGSDNSYLTAQPSESATEQLPLNWSLNGRLIQSQRYNNLSTSVVAPTWATFASNTSHRQGFASAPYSNFVTFQTRPILHQRVLPNGVVLTIEGVSTY